MFYLGAVITLSDIVRSGLNLLSRCPQVPSRISCEQDPVGQTAETYTVLQVGCP